MDENIANCIFQQNANKTPVLVDMDNILADCDATIDQELRRRYPELSIKPKNPWMWDAFDNKNSECALLVKEVINDENFWSLVQPLKTNIKNMLKLAQTEDVWIVSFPFGLYATRDQKKWVEKNIGLEWADRLILTKDKTLVKGAYLFSDRPDVTGKNLSPSWQHWLILRPYNNPSNFKSPNTGIWTAKASDPWNYFFLLWSRTANNTG